MNRFHGLGRLLHFILNSVLVCGFGLPGISLLTLMLSPVLILLTSAVLRKYIEASTLFNKRILSDPLLEETN